MRQRRFVIFKKSLKTGCKNARKIMLGRGTFSQVPCRIAVQTAIGEKYFFGFFKNTLKNRLKKGGI